MAVNGGIDGKSDSILLSVSEMARADAAAIARGTPGIELMEAAGDGIADMIMGRWAARPTVVLCGPGNNGGDGFVVARLLREAGWEVAVAFLGERSQLGGDAGHMADLWTGPIGPLNPDVLDGCSLVVDALFGAGLSRPLGGAAAAVIDRLNLTGATCVAVDIPSGVHGDTGAVLGTAARAACTVTFCRRKPGHILMPGRLHCGDVITVDIGIPDDVIDTIAPKTSLNGPESWLAALPRPGRGGHKYDRGHAVVVSGGVASTGAARLAARGALRAGAGLVSVACPADAVLVNACHLTAVMTSGFRDVEALAEVLADPRKNAVLIGPGNGITEATRRNVLKVLALKKTCVLDADALSVFASEPEALFAAIRSPCLMTPHWGEFARLFADLANSAEESPLGRDKVEAARAAARLSNSVILLKGAATVVAAPDGRAAINDNAPPDLATAGSGDVLAGLALGLLAQGMDPFAAGCAAVWLHGAAAAAFGPGLIAEDISEQLPAVLAELRSHDLSGGG